MTWRDPWNYDDACHVSRRPAFALLLGLRGGPACMPAPSAPEAAPSPSSDHQAPANPHCQRRWSAAVRCSSRKTVLPLTIGDGRILAIPQGMRYPSLARSVALLTQSREALRAISPTWDKRILEVVLRNAPPLRSRCPRRLSRGSRCLAHAPEGAMRLVANSYRSEMLDAEMRRREFALFSDLAATIPLLSDSGNARP